MGILISWLVLTFSFFVASRLIRGFTIRGGLLSQLFETFRGEGLTMAFTMEDFRRQMAKEHFPRLTPEERREALELLSPEERRKTLQSLPPEVRREVAQSLPLEDRLAGRSRAR